MTKNPKLNYFEKEDILHILISAEPEANSIELSPGVTVELNAVGEIIGVEILNASRFLRDFVLESVQGKLLALTQQPALAGAV